MVTEHLEISTSLPPARDLRPGDLVLVRSAAQILPTLDKDGCTDGVVFMPEMLEHVGQVRRVFRRLEKTCIEGSESGLNEFLHNDVVFLENARCSGASHDGCGRSCMIFWKEGWLEKINPAQPPPPANDDPVQAATLAARLAPTLTNGSYFCQSTNLLKATRPMPVWRRFWKCVRDVQVGTYGVAQMIRLVVKPLWGKMLLPFVARIPSTKLTKTPKGSLGLQPGDWVEVKSAEEIIQTLDKNGRNRGLQWSHDLAPYCGRRFQVSKRLDQMIVEYTSRMVQLSDTVLLDGARCPCKYAIGGCPRADLIYWREIWLRRVDAP